MTERCPNDFEQALISAHLDGELTQQESQRVRLHLEDCTSCRATFEELKQIREATMSTSFAIPDDDQWDERPRGGTSRLLLWVGFGLIAVAIVVMGILLVGEIADADTLDALLLIGLYGGGLLVLLSALIDRIRTYKADRYRRVQK